MQSEIKLALAQLNYKIGDFELNKGKILKAIEQAQSANVDLIIF